MKILACDDDPVIRYLLEVVLGRRGGHELVPVAHPDGVLAAVLEHQPDLVLLDYVLPGRNGLDVAAELRADARTADVPIVFLTGRIDIAETPVLESLKVAGVIEKPFETATLGARLEALRRVSSEL